MHSEYQHPSIQLFMMSLKPSDSKTYEIDTKSDETKQISDNNEDEDDSDSKNHAEEGDFELLNLPGKNISEWETRRYGAMAAKLLRDVKIV